jgi:hypothetical protein
MSEAALRQRRLNLKRTRIRSYRETAIIKRLIWQARFDGGERMSQRALARQLRVWPSYVWKVQRKVPSEEMDALLAGGRVTLDDLEEARSFTAKLRAQEPGLLAPPPSSNETQKFEAYATGAQREPSNPYQVMAHAKTLREWQESGRRVRFSVPLQH